MSSSQLSGSEQGLAHDQEASRAGHYLEPLRQASNVGRFVEPPRQAPTMGLAPPLPQPAPSLSPSLSARIMRRQPSRLEAVAQLDPIDQLKVLK